MSKQLAFPLRGTRIPESRYTIYMGLCLTAEGKTFDEVKSLADMIASGDLNAKDVAKDAEGGRICIKSFDTIEEIEDFTNRFLMSTAFNNNNLKALRETFKVISEKLAP